MTYSGVVCMTWDLISKIDEALILYPVCLLHNNSLSSPFSKSDPIHFSCTCLPSGLRKGRLDTDCVCKSRHVPKGQHSIAGQWVRKEEFQGCVGGGATCRTSPSALMAISKSAQWPDQHHLDCFKYKLLFSSRISSLPFL